MCRIKIMVLLVLIVGSLMDAGVCQEPKTKGVESNPDEQAVKQLTENFVKAFNAGKADDVAGLFLERAELTDDDGNIYKGRAEIADVFTRFFKKFPGATSKMTPDTVKFISPSLVIEEGSRTVSTKDGQATAATHYTFVKIKPQDQWKIASGTEVNDDSSLTPHDRLMPLAWLVGDWVDEGSDAVVQISCRWSEDKNFFLVDFNAKMQGKPGLKSSQRIGWDPLTQKVKSWVFDSDGGYGDGIWTLVEGRWVIKSNAVMPDGQTGSATIMLEPSGNDKYVMKGFDRIRGDNAEPDFEVTIVRKPPEPAK
jgi:uncharacterized protein (TIGR02246 family)